MIKCIKCGEEKSINEFYKGDYCCKDCYKRYQREYLSKNKQRIKERDRRYYFKHKENILKSFHTWYLENKEQHKQKVRKNYLKNKERYDKVWNKWASKNTNKLTLYSKRLDAQRRTQERNNGGSFTTQEWLNLCSQYGNRCLSCNKKLPLEVDHIIPVSRGGTSYISNIQPLCKHCNCSKGTKTMDYKIKDKGGSNGLYVQI